MRAAAFILLAVSTLIHLTAALQLPDFQPFTSALSHLFDEFIPESLQNSTAHDVLKRASNGCPSNFNSCANSGAANLCCGQGSVCSADAAGHVACCPSGAACTGVVSSTITAGTVNGAGGVVTGAASTTGTGSTTAAGAATTTSFQQASSQTTNAASVAGGQSTQQTNSGFIVAGGSTIATPAGAVRAAEIPAVVRVLIRALEYLPM